MFFSRATNESESEVGLMSAVLCDVPNGLQLPAFERQQGIYCLQLSCNGSLAVD
jgi:hypothetical protein